MIKTLGMIILSIILTVFMPFIIALVLTAFVAFGSLNISMWGLILVLVFVYCWR